MLWPKITTNFTEELDDCATVVSPPGGELASTARAGLAFSPSTAAALLRRRAGKVAGGGSRRPGDTDGGRAVTPARPRQGASGLPVDLVQSASCSRSATMRSAARVGMPLLFLGPRGL